MIPTVKHLRQSGYKVRVCHTRHYDNIVKFDTGLTKALSAKGGKTVVQITTPEGKDISGEAICSKEDSYNKKLGVKIAIGRALSLLS